MDEQTVCRYYFIAFIDVLGQREQLRRLTQTPTTSEEEGEALDILQSTAGFVAMLRQSFTDYFDAQSKPSTLFDSLPANQKRWAESVRKDVARHRGVSDSIVISIPIMPDNEQCNSLNSIYSALIGICGIMPTALAARHAVRGGADVGLGMPIEEDEIYGPAIERACRLEAEVARWPRVCVGNELWAYLSASENTRSQTPAGKLAQQWASLAKSLIVRTEEGDYMLDFLGETMRKLDLTHSKEVIEQGYAFIVQEHVRLSAERDEKLEARYRALRLYAESRLPLWGVARRTS